MAQQTTSPFLLPSGGLMLGFGAPFQTYYDTTALTATGTITLTPLGAQSTVIPFTKGRLRIKSAAVNAATTIAIGNITGTDGTSTVILSGTALVATTATAGLFDRSYEIVSDLQLTSISFTVTLGGGTTVATIDSELYCNP